MAIINNAMQAAPAAPPAPQAQAAPQAGGMDKIVQRIVTAATMAMNQPQTEQQILQIVKSSPDANGLAQATVTLMKALFQKSNKTMPPQAIGPAGKQVMLVIAKACQAAGILQVTPQLIQQAMAAAVKMIGSAPQQAAPQGAPAAPAAVPAEPMGA